MYSKKPQRLDYVIFFFLFLFFVIVVRLAFIQINRYSYLKNLALKQQNYFVELPPKRGIIYDRLMRPLTFNIPQRSLYGMPRQMSAKAKKKAIKYLTPLLNLSETFLQERLNRDKSFIWIERQLDISLQEKIEDYNLEGIGFIDEAKRVYPNANLASHIVGFSGIDNNGLEGVELFYDSYLKGRSGFQVVLRDALQRPLLEEVSVVPQDGFDLVLTIDEVVQFIVEKHLEGAYKKYNAKGASAIVMEPKTGRILALANFPNYDLNKDETELDRRRNRAICDMFEPGSVFKVVLASCALEEGIANEADKIFCENGAYKFSSHTLHDHHPHGWLTFKEVISESSNIGVVKVAQKIKPEVFYNYIKSYGFGSVTGIDLPGEISGSVPHPSKWSKTSIGAVPIGQEVGVTVVQLASCISAIANSGILMKPFIVERIQDKNGQVIKEFIPQIKQRVISEKTAQRLAKILTAVIDEGTGRLAKIANVSAAGKTGTAQKLEPNGAYSHSSFFANFIGFAPAQAPEIAVVVVVDEPRPVYFGGVVAAPVFKNIVTDVLNYLHAQPLSEQTVQLVNAVRE